VHSYQGYLEQTAGVLKRLEVPHPNAVLIISFGPRMRVLDHRDQAGLEREHTSFITGLHDSYVHTEFSGRSHGMQVNLTPLGAFQVFGVPMDRLTNRTIPLEDVFGRMAEALQQRLLQSSGWEARFAMLDTLFAARLSEASAPSSAIAWAWQRLTESRGRLSIGALAEEIGWSQRHFIAGFRAQIGLPPKMFARVLRFSQAVRLLNGSPATAWTQIAHDCGYYDQAHFIRDFRAFAGSTPGEYARARPASRAPMATSY
jgi:AraC-like DNA-binding protein